MNRSIPSRLTRRLAAAALLALLGGCGPGIGGTGTGATVELSLFGARALPVCASGELAPRLACTGAGSGAVVVVIVGGDPDAGGTAQVDFTSADGRVRVRLSGNGVQLDAPCLSLRFDGRWGQVGDGPPLFLGGYVVGTGPVQPATLRIVVETDGSFTLTLRDAAGGLLLGPVTVRRDGLGGTVATCGG